MPHPTADRDIDRDVRHELSEVGVAGHEVGERSKGAYVPPPVYQPRQTELFGPPLFLGALLLLFVLGIALVIPWGSQNGDALREAPIGMVVPELSGSTTDEATAASQATLHLQVHPNDAQVMVNDQPMSHGVGVAHPVEAGYLWISAYRDGYATLDTLVFAAAGRSTGVSLRLTDLQSAAGSQAEQPQQTAAASERPVPDAQPSESAPSEPAAEVSPLALEEPAPTRIREARLVVNVEPSDATILVDGVSAGQGTIDIATLPPGSYTIAARRDGFRTVSRTVTLEAGQARAVDLALSPTIAQTGTLEVVVRPWGSIYVDGELKASDTDLRVSISAPVGTRSVRAVHPQLGTSTISAEVRPDEVTSVVIDLIP